ncbi:MAG: aldo/keto reductase [Theionarchaea archaeon]|nr:aldo/keto reductase [Theionarchaea archaeon]MBU7038897.1 aldo/keto reductase [Theionarchaea archaeon]
METRILGKTGLTVGIIGLGTEYLRRAPRDRVMQMVDTAADHGVTYVDLVFNFADYLDAFATALEGRRDEFVLAVHLGSAERKGQYEKTRSLKKCEKGFHESLARLRTDHADIVNVHFVKTQKEYERVKKKGIFSLASSLKEEGMATSVGMSTHDTAVAVDAATSGLVDVIMIQINLANNAMPHRNEMLALCAKEKVGVVAMKPFAGGKLLQQNRTVNLAQHQTGGKALKKKIPKVITPTHCLSYILSQVGVTTVVPGVSSAGEFEGVLHYLKATEEEKDFSGLLVDFEEYVTGDCVYCNHCLPCPAGIDIGECSRLLDRAKQGMTSEMWRTYEMCPEKASACTECGLCVQRCPFGVDVVSRMKEAAILFEGQKSNRSSTNL